MRACALVALLFAAAPAPAQVRDYFGANGPPCREPAAGVADWAVCGRSDKYALGYVGGGCLGRCGEARRPDEGLFGWDYDHGWRPGRVFLTWCHCTHKPAGTYKADGPP